MTSLIIGAIIGILGSIGTAMFVEYMRRPKLKFAIETPPLEVTYAAGFPANVMRTLRVKLYNDPLPGWARWMLRGPALQCRAIITFHELNDGQNIFGRAMGGRWASSPEPVPISFVTPRGERFQMFDPARFTLESRIDIYPGEQEILDIASRFDNDQECYDGNNEAYFSAPPWRNPNWRLPSGRYLVSAVITSSGQKSAGCFRLMNNLSRADFRLELATRSDIGLLAAS
jgi:hypothetical protein